jgi:hypothetical protein
LKISLPHPTNQTHKIEQLPDDIQDLFNFMYNNRIDLECDNLNAFWKNHWEECPLCGSEIMDYDGRIIHNEKQ